MDGRCWSEVQVLRILKPDGHLLWTMKASQEEKSTEFGLFEQNLQVEQLYFSILHPGWDHCGWHTRDLMDFLQGLVKTGKCEIVKQERSKFLSFLFFQEKWRGLFVKHSRQLNLGRQVPRCLHSHKGRVLPHPSFGWKVELQKSIFLE